MIIKPYGDQAILVEFEAIISPEINQQVLALNQALNQATIEGITAYIPAYNSLTICFDPSITSFKQLTPIIHQLHTLHSNNTKNKPRKLTIPVCYEAIFALDLDDVLQQTSLQVQELIELHTANLYQVYLLGFLPGFAYLGKVPEALYCHRKATPRLEIPQGAVGLAGYQTGIYPSASPGGWQIIGQTPIPVFRPELEQPFLFQPGDNIQFEAIDKRTFFQIKTAIIQQQFNWDSIYG